MSTHFAFLGLAVADMAASLAFYRRLGVDVPASADGESHVQYVLPGGPMIVWDTHELIAGFDPGFAAPSGPPRAGLAFDCGDAAAVDATYEALVASGAEGHLKPFDAFWGQRYASLRDPDGNGVDLLAWLPGQGPDA